MDTNIYWLWLLIMGSLIFLMQAGFFLLEGGQVRSRDVTNVMMKMTGHLGLGILIFLLCGFAIKQYGWPLAALPNGWRYPWQFVGDGAQRVDGDQRQIGSDVVVRRDRAEIESEPAEHEQQRTQAHHGNVVRVGGRNALAEEAGAD